MGAYRQNHISPHMLRDFGTEPKFEDNFKKNKRTIMNSIHSYRLQNIQICTKCEIFASIFFPHRITKYDFSSSKKVINSS